MIVCDYCQLPIDPSTGDPGDRLIQAGINRLPDPPPPSLDLHARCVDPWIAAAKQIRKPPDQEA
jgi:hypothetical protein